MEPMDEYEPMHRRPPQPVDVSSEGASGPAGEPSRQPAAGPAGGEGEDPLLLGPGDEPTAEVLRVLEDYLAELEGGGTPSAQALLARHPDLAPWLQPYLASLDLLHAAAVHHRTPAEPPLPGPLGDFRILREIGRGGMGIVYEAEQVSLGRRVALKVLPLAAALDERQRCRFQRESQAAALLSHPHIVPVHAVGCERGLHYYAMRYIDGRSLAALIAAQGGQGHACVRTAARWGAEAAEALAHAHEQGVLHRDVKPGNLLVDRNDHLWVTDFGLARLPDDAGVTRTGDLLGTVRYMSPEQAQGRPGLVDQRSDVYALGVTLYELLTGHPAFAGRDPEELLRRIAHDTPLPLRRRNPAVPRDLDVIVSKAHARDPRDRYATAQDLADDLRRFLAGTPILARPLTPVQRLGRWALRHERLVLTATATGILLVLLSLVGTGLVWMADRHAGIVRGLAARQQVKTEEHLQLALQTLDEIYLRVVEERFGQNPNHQEDRDLLQSALRFYEQFAEQNRDSPQVRYQTAVAYRRVADIRQRLGQQEKARQAYERSLELFEGLTGDDADSPTYRYQAAAARSKHGQLLWSMGRLDEAGHALDQALAGLSTLALAMPREFACRCELAATYNLRGLFRREVGRLREAEEDIRRALALDEQLVADFPASAEAELRLSGSLHNLALLLQVTGRPRDAEVHFRRSLALLDRHDVLFPQAPDHHLRRAKTRHNLAVLLQEMDRGTDALAAFREALRDHEEVAAHHPNIPEYLRDLALAQQAYARALHGSYYLCDAEAISTESQEILEGLARDFPGVPGYRYLVACAWNNWANLCRTLHRAEEAEAAYGKALALLEALATELPNVPDYRVELARCCNSTATRLKTAGRMAEAEAIYPRARTLLERLVAEFPRSPDYRSYLAATLSQLADCAYRRHDLAGMRRLTEEAIAHRRRALEANPRHPGYQRGLRDDFFVLTLALRCQGDHAAIAQAARTLAQVRSDDWHSTLKAAEMTALGAQLAVSATATPAEQVLLEGYREQVRSLVTSALERGDEAPEVLNDAAWFLVTCPDVGSRDPGRALALARRAVEARPDNGTYWNTLGAAEYRAGNWQAAVSALEEAITRRQGGTSEDWTFLAMAHWQLGERQVATTWYEKLVQELSDARVQSPTTTQLHAEVRSLLGRATVPVSNPP